MWCVERVGIYLNALTQIWGFQLSKPIWIKVTEPVIRIKAKPLDTILQPQCHWVTYSRFMILTFGYLNATLIRRQLLLWQTGPLHFCAVASTCVCLLLTYTSNEVLAYFPVRQGSDTRALSDTQLSATQGLQGATRRGKRVWRSLTHFSKSHCSLEELVAFPHLDEREARK